VDEGGPVVDRLTVETDGFFTRRHRLLAAGVSVGEIALGFGSSASYTDAEGGQARMGRPSIWRAEYEMWKEGRVRGAARKPLFRRHIAVQFEGRSFLLRPTDLTLCAWELVGPTDEPVLTVRRRGWRGAEIVIHRPVDSDLLAFAYYLAVVRRRAARRRRA